MALYILIGIIILPLLLLAIPIQIDFVYDSSEQKKSQTRITWLFGLVHIRPNVSREPKEWENVFHEQPKKEKRKKRKKVKSHKNGLKAFIAVMQSKGFIRRIFRLFYEILTVAEISQLKACIFFGLDDPADTGRVYGLLAPSFSCLYAIPRVDFEAIPVFDRVIMAANIQTRIRVVPINYIKSILMFVFSKESLRAARIFVKVYRS